MRKGDDRHGVISEMENGIDGTLVGNIRQTETPGTGTMSCYKIPSVYEETTRNRHNIYLQRNLIKFNSTMRLTLSLFALLLYVLGMQGQPLDSSALEARDNEPEPRCFGCGTYTDKGWKAKE